MGFMPCLVRVAGAADREQITLGHPLLDAFLEFVTARARWNTVLATAFDLKVFFSIIETDPAEVTTADVLAFISAQRAPRRGATVVRIEDGEPGLSARTIKRRLATIAGLYEYLIVRGDTGVTRNPVPRGLAMRRPGATGGARRAADPRAAHPAARDQPGGGRRVDGRVAHAARPGHGRGDAAGRAAPLRGPRAAPRGPPARASSGVFIAEGKGGHQRIVPISSRVLHHASPPISRPNGPTRRPPTACSSC